MIGTFSAKEDGLWVEVLSPDGCTALINLTAFDHGAVVNAVLAEAWRRELHAPGSTSDPAPLRQLVSKWRRKGFLLCPVVRPSADGFTAQESRDRVAGALILEMADELDAALSASAVSGWQPIETAPRDSTHLLVYYPRPGEQRQEVMEAWWAIPYEAAPLGRGWWQTMGGTLLSADVHDGLGATHWMPLADPPAVVRAPGPRQEEPHE
jgi:hypothetical protein